MPGFDKRESAYAQARAELLREIDDGGLARLDQPQRGNEIGRIVRALGLKYPELDGQLTRRLLAEGLGADPDPDAALDRETAADLPDLASGQANVTSLQREERRSDRGDRRA